MYMYILCLNLVGKTTCMIVDSEVDDTLCLHWEVPEILSFRTDCLSIGLKDFRDICWEFVQVRTI